MHHVAHGEFGDLAGFGARNVVHLHDAGRHMARACAFADAGADLLFQRLVQRDALGQDDEKNDADIAIPFLADGDGFRHFRQAFHLRIDFRRADAHAAGIERRVRAAMNDHPVMRGDFGKIAMTPDAGEAREIGAVIFLAVGIVPEADGHGGKGLHADQFALARLALPRRERLSFLVPDIDGHAEAPALDLAAPDRKDGRAQHETGDNVGAARNGAERHILPDVAIDEIEALRHQRRASGEDHAHGRKIMRLARLEARLLHRVDEFGRCAEDVDLFRVDIVEKHALVGCEGRAVEKAERRFRREAGDEPVPHHPAAGGEVEEALARLDVAMELVLLQMLEKRAARRMDDAFGHAGRAAGKHDVERMAEGQPREGKRRIARALQKRRPAFDVRQVGNVVAEEGHDDGMFERGKPGHDLRELVAARQFLAGIAIAVAGHQHPGLDLAEAVQHAFRAEIGRAGRKDRADGSRRQHGDDGFRAVGHEGGHAVAGLHAPALQHGGETGHLGAQGVP